MNNDLLVPSNLGASATPCPFCGGVDISDGEVLAEHPRGRVTTQSMCRTCGALGPEAALLPGEVDYGSVKSRAEWNRREGLSRIEELEQKLKTLKGR